MRTNEQEFDADRESGSVPSSMTPGSDPQPIPYLSVYLLAIPTPEVNMPLGTFDGVEVKLIRGPFAVERSIPPARLRPVVHARDHVVIARCTQQLAR